MRTILKGAVMAALLATAAPALAQTGGVLIIDMDKLLSDSLAAKNAQTQLQGQFSGTQTQVQNELQAAGTALQAQENAVRTALGGTQDASKIPPATQTAYANARNRFNQAQQNAGAVGQAIDELRQYFQGQIIQAVLPIAEAVRAERRGTVVVPKGSVLAADPAGDVTAVVLPRLDAALKTVAPPPPQPAQGAGTAPAAPAPAAAPPAAGARRPQPQGR